MALELGENGHSAAKILVINPNSSRTMTGGLDKMIAELHYSSDTQIDTYTAPFGPNSINNEADAHESAQIVRDDLAKGLIRSYSALLVCCYSIHPLIPMLRELVPASVPVVGIFEASISTALSLLAPPVNGSFEKCGIVSTGQYWEKVLGDGVLDYLGAEDLQSCKRFKGVETTGLTAGELHTAPPEEVRMKMKQAVQRLVKDGDVKAVCLGCAGMAGMDEMVREACVEELGMEKGGAVHIIDGVKAGIAMLDGTVRSRTAGAI